MQYIAFDSHKRYTFVAVEDSGSGEVMESRIEHERGAIKEYLGGLQAGSPVALETIGNWYWIVEEIEAAGMQPRLVHARRAKMMLASRNKTDRLDAHGMNRLQRSQTLPTVWIPGAGVRDNRELYRTRMALARERTRVKNRIHATLDKHAIRIEETSSIFNKKGRAEIQRQLQLLPPQTRFACEQLLATLEELEQHIEAFEQRISEVSEQTPEVQLLRTIPGVGAILSFIIAGEIGDVSRFPRAENLASYAGTTPTVHASGGKVRYRGTAPDVNRYLKWAFVEAANSIVMNARHLRHHHAIQLYQRIRERKGHAVAIGAVARHLAEATYWVLTKQEVYRDPARSSAESSTNR